MKKHDQQQVEILDAQIIPGGAPDPAEFDENANKKVIGYTTGSVFQDAVKEMIESPAGLDAISLKIDQDENTGLGRVLGLCDAFILIGGRDICPLTFGQDVPAHCQIKNYDIDRDKRELFLLDYAAANNKKVFGICRGFQLIGVTHNMYLIPNINNCDIVHQPSAHGLETDGQPVHRVKIHDPMWEELIGDNKCLSNSFHHQALNYNPDTNYEQNYGIKVIGTARLNKKTNQNPEWRNIELMEDINGNWLACQFHPEMMNSPVDFVVIDRFKQMVNL